jgi:hypothetical protein
MTARKLGIVVAVACSISGTAEATTNLKPFDPVALQSVVEATAKELLLPGAMVLLRTAISLSATVRRSWAARIRRAPTRISGPPQTPRR